MVYYYIDLSLKVQSTFEENLTDVLFKAHIINSLKNLFGEVGACIPVDLLKYDASSQRGIVRCPSASYVKVHSAVTLAGTIGESQCAYRVHQTSPFLLSLLGNSRNYSHIPRSRNN